MLSCLSYIYLHSLMSAQDHFPVGTPKCLKRSKLLPLEEISCTESLGAVRNRHGSNLYQRGRYWNTAVTFHSEVTYISTERERMPIRWETLFLKLTPASRTEISSCWEKQAFIKKIKVLNETETESFDFSREYKADIRTMHQQSTAS